MSTTVIAHFFREWPVYHNISNNSKACILGFFLRVLVTAAETGGIPLLTIIITAASVSAFTILVILLIVLLGCSRRKSKRRENQRVRTNMIILRNLQQQKTPKNKRKLTCSGD